MDAEIARLPGVADPAFVAAAAGATSNETLVCAIRRLCRAGNEVEARRLAETLVERCAPLVARAARAQFARNDEDRKDAANATALQLWREVLDTSPKELFWEYAFSTAVFRTCGNVAAKMRSQSKREQPLGGGADEAEAKREEDNIADVATTDPDALLAAVHSGDVLREALLRLEGNVRRAMYLKVQGLKEKSNDPLEPTISKLLGVSDRMVRNYLRKAEDELRPWLSAAGHDRTGETSQ